MSLALKGPHGTITVPEGVLVRIAADAAESVEGIRVRRKRSVDAEARTVRLELSARPGDALIAQGEQVQEAVAAAFAATCGIEVTVDVAFEELA
jgi:uncharacterized alkaline shock family protein YloU